MFVYWDAYARTFLPTTRFLVHYSQTHFWVLHLLPYIKNLFAGDCNCLSIALANLLFWFGVDFLWHSSVEINSKFTQIQEFYLNFWVYLGTVVLVLNRKVKS